MAGWWVHEEQQSIRQDTEWRCPTVDLTVHPDWWVGTIFWSSYRNISLRPWRIWRGQSWCWAPALLEGSVRRRVPSRRSGISAVSFVVHSPPPQLLAGHLCQMLQRGWNTDLSHTSQITIWGRWEWGRLERRTWKLRRTALGQLAEYEVIQPERELAE